MDDHALAALAVAAVTAGDRRKAVSALATLSGHDLGDLPRSSSWMVTMHGVAEAAYLLDDTATAARVYELLSPYGHLPMVGSLAVACFGSAHHALGVAALTTGDVDRAAAHLRDAVRQNLALAHWPAVTVSRERLATALVRAGRQPEADAVRREMAVVAEEAAPAPAPAPAESAGHGGDGQRPPAAFCTRLGRKWRIGLGEHSVLVENSVGVLHLAVLIANPRQEIRAVDLVAGLTALKDAKEDSALSGQPLLDRVAMQEYRSRLTRLRTELDELEAAEEHDQAAVARAEHDWLVGQLAGATGLSGRARRFPEGEERSRVAVRKAVRRALDRIAAADPGIGGHLRHAVHTGVRCSYWPD